MLLTYLKLIIVGFLVLLAALNAELGRQAANTLLKLELARFEVVG